MTFLAISASAAVMIEEMNANTMLAAHIRISRLMQILWQRWL
jgi:hypothetical protein